jgi:hypothetical protein
MSDWLQNPLVVVCFVGILLLFFGVQDLILVPPQRRDAVSGVLWIAAAISLVCLGISRQYDHQPSTLLLLIIFLATGTVAIVWKIVGLVRSWGA